MHNFFGGRGGGGIGKSSQKYILQEASFCFVLSCLVLSCFVLHVMFLLLALSQYVYVTLENKLLPQSADNWTTEVDVNTLL